MARVLKLSTKVKKLVASSIRQRRSRPKRETAAADRSRSMATICSVPTRSMLSQKRWLVSCAPVRGNRRRTAERRCQSASRVLLRGSTQRLSAASSRYCPS